MVVELDEITDPDGEAELELFYVVPGASWEPGYDIRVRGTDVTVTSYGLVSQHTGEDWPVCELALSTARPASTVVVPELRPWYLDRAQPIRPMAPAAYAGVTPGGAPDCARVERLAAPRAMARRFAEVEQGMTAVPYRPSRPVVVPSGAQGHRTTLALLDRTVELGHVTAPVLAQEAYRARQGCQHLRARAAARARVGVPRRRVRRHHPPGCLGTRRGHRTRARRR